MVDFFQQLSLVKRFRSKVAIAEITDTRFDEKFLIDFRIDCRRNDPHLRESVRYRMHTCSKKKQKKQTKTTYNKKKEARIQPLHFNIKT